jgi:NAD(P)-dependent dehydrogenase (short-subunit alcohol dehydrogenase family)
MAPARAGQVAVVTGAGRGIGRAVAFAREGARVVLYLLSLSERAAVDPIYIRRRNSAAF